MGASGKLKAVGSSVILSKRGGRDTLQQVSLGCFDFMDLMEESGKCLRLVRVPPKETWLERRKEGTRKGYFSWNIDLGGNQGHGAGGKSSLPSGYGPCRGIHRSQGNM